MQEGKLNPRALPWARSFCPLPFRYAPVTVGSGRVGQNLRKFSYEFLHIIKGLYATFSSWHIDPQHSTFNIQHSPLTIHHPFPCWSYFYLESITHNLPLHHRRWLFIRWQRIKCFISFRWYRIKSIWSMQVLPHTPWARSFWAFSPFLNHMWKFSN